MIIRWFLPQNQESSRISLGSLMFSDFLRSLCSFACWFGRTVDWRRWRPMGRAVHWFSCWILGSKSMTWTCRILFLVVWDMAFMTFHVLDWIGNSNPNWLSYFSEGLRILFLVLKFSRLLDCPWVCAHHVPFLGDKSINSDLIRLLWEQVESEVGDDEAVTTHVEAALMWTLGFFQPHLDWRLPLLSLWQYVGLSENRVYSQL